MLSIRIQNLRPNRWKPLAKLILALFIVFDPGRVLAATSNPNVLILWSYNDQLPWQSRVRLGLSQRLEAQKNQFAPALYEERLDAARLDSTDVDAYWADDLRRKYDGVRFDSIVTESGPAAVFLSRHPNLFPGAKRFIIDSEEEVEQRAGEHVAAEEDFVRQMRVILEVLPQTRRLVVVGNLLPSRVERAHKVWNENFKDRVTFEAWTDDFSFAELNSRASQLSLDTVVLYQLVNHDRTGLTATPYEVLTNLAAAASVPVFATHDTLMGSGAVGGYLLSGERVGAMIADVLGGAAPNSFHNGYFSVNQFDDRALKRWKILDERLPADSQILYREPTLWQRSGAWILAVSIEGIFVLVLVWALVSRRRAFAELRTLATTDSLTGTLNRREFLRQLDSEWSRIQRHEGYQTTVLMLDVDHFKSINDSRGHKAGDAALAQLGALLRRSVRKFDTVARIGGEEFAIILPGASVQEGTQFADRLRSQAAEMSILFDSQEFKMTVSIGISSILHKDHESTVAMTRADRALYLAKDLGRNRVAMM